MKKTLLIIGCGDIALRTAPLLARYYRLLGLTRRTENFSKLRSHQIIPLLGDLDQQASLKRLSGIADAIIHLAPPPNMGLKDTRTRHLLAALSRQHSRAKGRIPHRLVYISTSGVYGDRDGQWVGEHNPVKPRNDRAWRRFDAECQIRKWGTDTGSNVTILRVPGIYAIDRLPIARLKQGTPALLEKEDSYTNHIHADDLARIIVAAFRYGKNSRIYNACDDSSLKMGDYFDLVADTFKLPHPPRISRAQAKEQIPAGLLSFMEESRRLTNDRMKRELRIKLLYPTVHEGISKVIPDKNCLR